MTDQYYDDLETRDPELRARELAKQLARQIAHAKAASRANTTRLRDVDPDAIRSLVDLRNLPILRKSELLAMQEEARGQDPFAGYAACGWAGMDAHRPAKRVFQSPGPIYEPQGTASDSMRAARALHAAGFRAGDLVHNSFSYHMTPAGVMMEEGALAVGCTVFPAGVGNSELQLRAMLDLRPQGYTGTPGFLKTLLESALAQEKRLSVRKALFSGEAFPTSLREWMRGHEVEGFQCYASADLGMIAYETAAREGLVVDEGVVVEIVEPLTGAAVPEGQIGEVVVTSLSDDYPLLRFATGDLSAVLPGRCPTGRTNVRLRGWLGRADQSTKVRGMFVHPAQIHELLRRHPELLRARLVIDGEVASERMVLRAEISGAPPKFADRLVASVRDVTKLRAEVEVIEPGELEDDGKVIEDRRNYS